MKASAQDNRAVDAVLKALDAETLDFGTPLPPLTKQQRNQLAMLGPLFRDWNAKINVISRKDLDQFFARHVLHSLAIARLMRPESGARILDVGTGGGFPGLPLAILFPDAHFTLCDSIGKKIKVVDALKDVAIILVPMLILLILVIVFPEMILFLPRWLAPQFL